MAGARVIGNRGRRQSRRGLGAVALVLLVAGVASPVAAEERATAAAPQTSANRVADPALPWSPFEASISELQAAMESGRTNSAALVDYYLDRIASMDPGDGGLNAIAALNARARTEAALLDAERQERGARGPLHGIPIVLKDNIHTTDMPTTAGSALLAGFVTVDDAAVTNACVPRVRSCWPRPTCTSGRTASPTSAPGSVPRATRTIPAAIPAAPAVESRLR